MGWRNRRRRHRRWGIGAGGIGTGGIGAGGMGANSTSQNNTTPAMTGAGASPQMTSNRIWMILGGVFVLLMMTVLVVAYSIKGGKEEPKAKKERVVQNPIAQPTFD